MKKFLHDKIGHGLPLKVLVAIFILGAVDMLSMTAPYYLKYVIPGVHDYMGINQAQFDSLNATMGWIVLATQIPSGLLADRVSSRRLLIVSVFMTGIATLMWVLTMQSSLTGDAAMTVYYMVFSAFGVSTTLFLWAPLWKILSQQGTKEQQSSIYGLHGSFNGFLGLAIVTLIGTIATAQAANGQDGAFYFLVYFIVGSLFLSGFGIWKFIPETHQESSVLLFIKGLFSRRKDKVILKNPEDANWLVNFKVFLEPLSSMRVWLLSFFMLGMYMFQSVFAYYMVSYLHVIALNATVIVALAGFRTYGLRTLVSAPFGRWAEKRKSWILLLVIILSVGFLMAIGFMILPGIGNTYEGLTAGYKKILLIVMPILFILIGASSWLLVTLRYAQIGEVPTPKNSYGTTVAILSLVAFSSDAWFYQMASSWMTNGNYINDAGSYTQEGLQLILTVALSFVAFGIICGIIVFIWNTAELKKLGKTDYRWRSVSNGSDNNTHDGVA